MSKSTSIQFHSINKKRQADEKIKKGKKRAKKAHEIMDDRGISLKRAYEIVDSKSNKFGSVQEPKPKIIKFVSEQKSKPNLKKVDSVQEPKIKLSSVQVQNKPPKLKSTKSVYLKSPSYTRYKKPKHPSFGSSGYINQVPLHPMEDLSFGNYNVYEPDMSEPNEEETFEQKRKSKQTKPKKRTKKRLELSDSILQRMKSTFKKGGKKRRKHKGINQQTGRLKKGYKYSGRKLKSGLSQIIRRKKLN